MKKFKLSHSVVGTIALLIVEAVLISTLANIAIPALLVCAAVGFVGILYVATEVVEEVRNIRRMMILLCVVLAEFVIFSAFQYHFLSVLSPMSYPTLGGDVTSLLLNSLMVFVFNPLYIPADTAGRWLLILNTGAALGLVFFVLQNIWQLRGKE